MKRFVRMARRELVIIDPYFADCVLPLVAQKRQGVSVLVVRNSRSRLLHGVDVDRFNAQYGGSLTVRVSDRFHDRFLIIDGATLIHVGASLNHLGRKCFAFSSLDKSNIRRVAEPPRQEVLRVLVARQVQHPGHPGQALNARRRRPGMT